MHYRRSADSSLLWRHDFLFESAVAVSCMTRAPEIAILKMNYNPQVRELFLAYRVERAARRVGIAGTVLALVVLGLGLYDLVRKVMRVGWANIGW